MDFPSTIFIGVDLGTTYTGVAFNNQSTTEGELQPFVIHGWPHRPSGTDTPKVPSEVAYTSQGYRSGITSTQVNARRNQRQSNAPAECDWGYAITPDQRRVRYFKLLVKEGHEMPESTSLEETNHEMMVHRPKAVNVMSDFVKKILDFTREALNEQFRDAATFLPKQVVLSVPARWDDCAIAHSRKAFHLAGFGFPLIVKEPDAAAHWAIPRLNAVPQISEAVMIVDAGGGTVDVMSFRATGALPLDLVEVTRGTTKICGSVLINGEFERKVIEKIGSARFHDMKTNNRNAWLEGLHFFENTAKRLIRASDERVWEIPLPGEHNNVVQYGILPFESAEIRDLFQNSIREIIDMIYKEAESVLSSSEVTRISQIVLVGGFGSSSYLRSELQRLVNPRQLHCDSIRMLSSPDAWSAVTCGIVKLACAGRAKPTFHAWPHYGVAVMAAEDGIRASSRPSDSMDEESSADESDAENGTGRTNVLETSDWSDGTIPIQPFIEAYSEIKEGELREEKLVHMSPFLQRGHQFDVVLITSTNVRCPPVLKPRQKKPARIRCTCLINHDPRENHPTGVYFLTMVLRGENMTIKVICRVNDRNIVLGRQAVRLQQV